MRLLGYVLAACVFLAVAKAAAVTLLLLLALGFIAALLSKPRETLGLTLLLSMCRLIQEQPGTLIIIIGLLVAGCLVGKLIERRGGSDLCCASSLPNKPTGKRER